MAQICPLEGAVWLENVKKEILVLVGSAFVFSFFFLTTVKIGSVV